MLLALNDKQPPCQTVMLALPMDGSGDTTAFRMRRAMIKSLSLIRESK